MSVHRRFVLPVVAASLFLTFSGCAMGRQEARPALVVLIVVDQLRPDLLERYDPFFTGGLRRILDHGRYYIEAVHDHAASETAPGHATLATGVFPSRHGLIANQWEELVDGRWMDVYNTADTLERIIGMPAREGRSPRNLLREGLADWIAAANPAARIVSVAGKDRAAIPMGGKSRGQVYWLVESAGRFATSTYYRSQYPDWVVRFHQDWVGRFMADTVWTNTVPAAAAALARRDTVPYEGDGEHTFFPHSFAQEGSGSSASDYFRWFAYTPYLDEATLAFARTAVEALDVGQDGVTDLLAVGLSATDRIGHDYGPFSLEQLDNLLRLDRRLGEFLGFLDESVGRGRYVLALSSDHGVAITPEYAQEIGQVGRRLRSRDLARAFEVAEQAGGGPAAADQASGSARATSGEDRATARAAAAVEQLDFVADAIPRDDLAAAPGVPTQRTVAWGRAESADSFMALFQRSYYPGRVPPPFGRVGLQVRLTEGTTPSGGGNGGEHGTPYVYDRHVPVIFVAPGLAAARVPGRIRTVDVAPTLAHLSGIPFPNDLDGRRLAP